MATTNGFIWALVMFLMETNSKYKYAIVPLLLGIILVEKIVEKKLNTKVTLYAIIKSSLCYIGCVTVGYLLFRTEPDAYHYMGRAIVWGFVAASTVFVSIKSQTWRPITPQDKEG